MFFHHKDILNNTDYGNTCCLVQASKHTQIHFMGKNKAFLYVAAGGVCTYSYYWAIKVRSVRWRNQSPE
jgi:hypothetical protein